jgi:OOP family OmpA-OmpF porin
LDDLRWLLFAPEQKQIQALRHRLDDPAQKAEELSECIAEALAIRSRQDHKLQATLQPLIEDALRVGAARNPQRLAASIAAVLGPALLTTASRSLRRGLGRLDHLLGRALSMETLRWRFKSWQSGHPLTAVSLTSSRRYRVEQAFVLDRKTGRVLGQAGEIAGPDHQLLAAIEVLCQAANCYSLYEELPKPKKAPESFEIGDRTLWLRHGPSATLAAITSGYAPRALGQQLETEIEIIHQLFAPYLEKADVDPEFAAALGFHLRGCLTLGRRKIAAKPSFKVVWGTAVIFGICATACAGWRILDNQRWAHYIGRLRSEPGIVVIETQRSWTGFSVRGLRDPLAADPLADLAGSGIPAMQVSEQWEPYLSLDPIIAARRSGQTPHPTSRVVEKIAAPD